MCDLVMFSWLTDLQETHMALFNSPASSIYLCIRSHTRFVDKNSDRTSLEGHCPVNEHGIAEVGEALMRGME